MRHEHQYRDLKFTDPSVIIVLSTVRTNTFSLSLSPSLSTPCLLPTVRRQYEGSLGKAEAASLCDTNRLLHYQTPSVATSELTHPCTYLSHLLSAEAPINVVNVVYTLTVWHNAQ